MEIVTLAEIRTALDDANRAALRSLYNRALLHGIAHCDPRQRSTLSVAMLECSLFGASLYSTLWAMLDAVEGGRHPYDDGQARAAIAQAQLDAMVGRGP